MPAHRRPILATRPPASGAFRGSREDRAAWRESGARPGSRSAVVVPCVLIPLVIEIRAWRFSEKAYHDRPLRHRRRRHTFALALVVWMGGPIFTVAVAVIAAIGAFEVCEMARGRGEAPSRAAALTLTVAPCAFQHRTFHQTVYARIRPTSDRLHCDWHLCRHFPLCTSTTLEETPARTDTRCCRLPRCSAGPRTAPTRRRRWP